MWVSDEWVVVGVVVGAYVVGGRVGAHLLFLCLYVREVTSALRGHGGC